MSSCAGAVPGSHSPMVARPASVGSNSSPRRTGDGKSSLGLHCDFVHPSSLLGVALASRARSSDPCFLACFLACFRARRSRSAASRLSLAIVVLFWELAAIHIHPSFGFRARRRRARLAPLGGKKGIPGHELFSSASETRVLARRNRAS